MISFSRKKRQKKDRKLTKKEIIKFFREIDLPVVVVDALHPVILDDGDAPYPKDWLHSRRVYVFVVFGGLLRLKRNNINFLKGLFRILDIHLRWIIWYIKKIIHFLT